MKKHLGLAAGLAALLSSGALASDLNGSLKDEPFANLQSTDFSGFYAGVGVGGEFLGADPETNNGTIGGVIDGVIGYDFRRGSFVIGPRLVGGLTNLDDEEFCNTALDAFLNFGGRVGVVFNRTLVYAHGGYEIMWASSDHEYLDSQLANADLNAVTAGLGVETILISGWSLAAEATYVSGLNDAKDMDGYRGVFRLNHQF